MWMSMVVVTMVVVEEVESVNVIAAVTIDSKPKVSIPILPIVLPFVVVVVLYHFAFVIVTVIVAVVVVLWMCHYDSDDSDSLHVICCRRGEVVPPPVP